jgi:hypothetical protein
MTARSPQGGTRSRATNGKRAPATAGRPDGATDRVTPLTQARAAGGRLTKDETRGFGSFGLQVILPPPMEGQDWALESLTREAFRQLKPAQLVSRLIRLSPEFGRAAFDFLRLANPGWEVTALRPGTTDQPEDRGQAAVDDFMARLADRHGSADVPINRCLFAMWLRGAFFAELVLDRAGRMPLDLATPDPYSVRFRLDEDPDYGQVWTLGQHQIVGFVPLDRPTVRYVPVDPLPGSPYGVAPAGPGLFPAVFLLLFLHDLRRVIAQQGMPRLDIKIITERVIASLPPGMRSDQAKVREVVKAAVDAVAKAYSELEPDDAYVHTDDIEMGKPIGTVGDDLLGGVGGIVETIERMNVRGLKTMPLLFGITDAVSEANANRQWEIHAAGIKAIQHLCETPLSRLLTLALEAQGIGATVEFRFAEMRSAEELRDAQTLNQKLVNAELMESLGYESHEGASVYATGHEPPADAEPEEEAEDDETENESDAADVVPEPGANRSALDAVERAPIDPVGDAPDTEVPETVGIDDGDVSRAVSAWNESMDGWEGLLDATVVDRDEDGEA